MFIKIDHIAKIEGHASFIADIIKGDIKKARLDVQEGARLIEGILVGRHHDEAPIITSRICGVCPVVHCLTAVKAMESALKIKPASQTILLRELLMNAQFINSHIAHLFLFSLADFFGFKSDFQLAKKHPIIIKDAFKVRDFANKLIEVIGGRTIHPLTPAVGGFRKLPLAYETEELLVDCLKLKETSYRILGLFATLKYPSLERSTRRASLVSDKYAIYDGRLKLGGEKEMAPENFIKEIQEFQLAESAVKSTKFKGETFMVGAISRLNAGSRKLNSLAKKILKKSRVRLPSDNPFHNILAQAIETMHCLEECEKILRVIQKRGLKEANVVYKIKAGAGWGAIEAPRGTLYHYYEIGDDGVIENVNIITPTAQNLSRLEDDLIAYWPNIKSLSKIQQMEKIKMLIRAYDPCLTCAVH